MLITFLVRSASFSEVSYKRFYTDAEGAFDLAYILNENSKVIEFKCFQDDYPLDTMPGTSYTPSKLVRTFDYSKEHP